MPRGSSCSCTIRLVSRTWSVRRLCVAGGYDRPKYSRDSTTPLECAANPRSGSSGGWMAVDPVPGGIAVNIGDMLSRWSSGRLLSNLHRVRMPTAAECSPPRSRFSMAFFTCRRTRALSSHQAMGKRTSPRATTFSGASSRIMQSDAKRSATLARSLDLVYFQVER